MMTVSSKSSSLDNTLDIKTDTDYLKIAKKGGGHQGIDQDYLMKLIQIIMIILKGTSCDS